MAFLLFLDVVAFAVDVAVDDGWRLLADLSVDVVDMVDWAVEWADEVDEDDDEDKEDAGEIGESSVSFTPFFGLSLSLEFSKTIILINVYLEFLNY